MDPKSNADDNLPPIPTRHHFHLPSRDNRTSRHREPPPPKPASIPPANPEVISNLITSLSAISQPANSHFESPPATTPFPFPAVPSSNPGYTSPSSGSFGVDYGAYTRPKQDKSAEGHPGSLDNLAASAPVIRTSKPTSGYSPLASPKSPPPHNRSSSRESGLRSFLRGSGISGGDSPSRPSSPLSINSKNDDAQSIGNLSIERGSAQTPELRHRRSHDSWSRKASRTTKGLMYMSSKERLHDKDRDLDGNRVPVGIASTTSAAGSTHHAGRAESFLADTPIREEPHSRFDELILNEPTMATPKPIPARDSSLRKSAASTKRSSARRSKRESDAKANDAILEAEEHEHESDLPLRNHSRKASERGTASTSFLFGPDEHHPVQPLSPSKAAWLQAETNFGNIDFDDDAAPFPVAAQTRRHDTPGRLSPAPKDISRSNSRLKRLSGPLSPRSESRASAASPEPSQSTNTIPAGYERPASADSIDDAVESYLCSPRLSQKIRHPQTGRVISFSEVGDANGSAVFCCVGMGLTRYITAFYDELALTLKLRLITPDRPGVGGSEPYTDGATTPLSWPDDVYAICQALKITKFSILAHSAGAIYALATALRMPQHIRGRIHLLAPWIPPSQMNVFGGHQTLPPTNSIPTSQKILRALPTPLLKAANSSFMSATSSSITSSLPKNPRKSKRKSNANGKDSNNTANSRNATPMGMDKENVNTTPQKDDRTGTDASPAAVLVSPNATENMDQIQPSGSGIGGTAGHADAADSNVAKERQTTYDLRLTHAIWELATTGANPAVDLLVCLERRHTIGFRYVDITRPVVIHHGSRDTRVPVENVKWLGKTMRRCEVRVLEGEGHGLMASATVMGSVLMEMSKEWEDWMRVTGADGRKDHERGRRVTLGR